MALVRGDPPLIDPARAQPRTEEVQKPAAWRHKHYPNEPWKYCEHETFGTPYPYYEPLFLAVQPTEAPAGEERAAALAECITIAERAAKRCVREETPGDGAALFIAERIRALAAVAPERGEKA
jgi:hypothetical protein